MRDISYPVKLKKCMHLPVVTHYLFCSDPWSRGVYMCLKTERQVKNVVRIFVYEIEGHKDRNNLPYGLYTKLLISGFC